MELCVGMICGTIPTLRPLFVSRNETLGSNQGVHNNKSPIRLSSLETDDPRIPSKAPKILQFSPCFPSRTISEEQRIVSYDEHQIRRTMEVEVSNEVVEGSDEVTGDYQYGWNIV